MHGFIQDTVRLTLMQIDQVNQMTVLDLRDNVHSQFADAVFLVDMDSLAEVAVQNALTAIDALTDHFRAQIFPMNPELDKLKTEAIEKVKVAGRSLNELPATERD